MKLAYAVLGMLCLGQYAIAGDRDSFFASETNPLNFSAPVVYNRANVTEAGAGTIVYDNSSGAFYGLSPGGNPSSGSSWLQLGAPTGFGQVNVNSVSTSNQHVESATVNGSSTFASNCTSGTCNLYATSGNWISVVHSSTGLYTATFSAGVFSSVPSCTVSAINTAPSLGWCSVYAGSTPTNTSYTVQCASGSGGSASDMAFTIVCMGPH